VTGEAIAHREAAASAQQRGDMTAANEAYLAELAALDGRGPVSLDDLNLLSDVDYSAVESVEAEAPPSAAAPEQFPEFVPIAVEHNDGVYSAFKTEHGEDAASELQRYWGNEALANERIVAAVIQDNPEINNVYAEHQNDAGLSFEGAQAMFRYAFEKSGIKSPEAFLSEYGELDQIFFDHADSDGNLSAVGLRRALHYWGQKSGYKYQYRGK